MLNNKEFARLFYNGEQINPDQIEDATLRGMYVEYLATELDLEDLHWKIGRYLDATGERYAISGAGDAYIAKQSN